MTNTTKYHTIKYTETKSLNVPAKVEFPHLLYKYLAAYHDLIASHSIYTIVDAAYRVHVF